MTASHARIELLTGLAAGGRALPALALALLRLSRPWA
jgi:hypothetical protein